MPFSFEHRMRSHAPGIQPATDDAAPDLGETLRLFLRSLPVAGVSPLEHAALIPTDQGGHQR